VVGKPWDVSKVASLGEEAQIALQRSSWSTRIRAGQLRDSVPSRLALEQMGDSRESEFMAVMLCNECFWAVPELEN
jgi:hypothetical protein